MTSIPLDKLSTSVPKQNRRGVRDTLDRLLAEAARRPSHSLTNWRGTTRSFEGRLFCAMLLIAIALLPVLGIALRSLYTTGEAQKHLDGLYVRTYVLVEDLRHEQDIRNTLVPLYVFTGDAALLQRIERSRTSFDDVIRALRALRLPGSEGVALDEVAALRARLAIVEDPGLAARRLGRAAADVDAYFKSAAVPLVRALNDRIHDLRLLARQSYDSAEAGNERDLHHSILAAAGALSLAIATMLVTAHYLFKIILRKKIADIADAKAADRVRAVAQARKEAVEIVAHDLRNPLSIITLLADQLTKLVDDERSLTKIDGITTSAEAMALLISNLHDHTKIEAGTLTLSSATADPAPLLHGMLARYQLLGAKRGVEIIDALPLCLPPLAHDAARIDQIFSNLLGNAIKFTSPGGRVTVDGEIKAEQLILRVSDTGRGMTEDQLLRVFDRYWQAGETASWGAGLGLAISKAIIEAHGGTIAAQSIHGKGTTFTLILPRDPPPPHSRFT